MTDGDRGGRYADPAPGVSPGPGVDRFGTPVTDPTPNVLDLVRAAIERQDDLRKADADHARDMANLRHGYEQQLREAGRYEADTRARYEDRLREKETQRLDAIRAVDVANVESQRLVAEARANTLAAAQQASAEALRGQVEQQRTTTAEALVAALVPLQRAVEELRQTQYQQQGEKTSRVESGTDKRDELAVEAAKIQAASQRTQVYALIIAALVLVVGLYATFHH